MSWSKPAPRPPVVAVGIDVAMANMGFVKALVNPDTLEILKILDLKLASTEPDKSKGVSRSDDRLRRGRELLQEMRVFCYGAFIAVAEIPEGSQDANAAWCMGVATGIVCACSIPLIPVTPRDVKAVTGIKNADKEAMRQWAYSQFPDAAWLTHGKRRTNNNEHLADALAALTAGTRVIKFQNMIGHNQVNGDAAARRRLTVIPERRRLKT